MFQEKIQAVENNLLPAITIKGRPKPPMNLAERMKRYNVPGVSIAVVDQAAVEWARGYGVLEAGGDVAVTPEILFQAASISKPVSAMAALHLVQSGVLDLDADVNQVLRSWQVPENEHTRERPVTLRGLLSHTAGLTVHGFDGYAAGAQIPTLPQVLDGEPPANSDPVRVDLVPGAEWRYSGGGYTVMQQLLEDATGQPFPTLMQATILDRLGMHRSTFEQPLPQQFAVQGASGHRGNGRPLAGRWHTYPEMAAAGLWTTPSDLARFAIEIIKSRAGRSNQVLSAAMTQQMLTPPLGDYGLGLGVREIEGLLRFSHGGGNAGFRCTLVAYPDIGQGAVVMTNGDAGEELWLEVTRSIARVYGWKGFETQEKAVAQVDHGIYARYEGEYQYVDYPEYGVLIARENDHLVLEHWPDGIRVQLYPASETTYFMTENDEEITFASDTDGNVDSLVIGTGLKLQRVEELGLSTA